MAKSSVLLSLLLVIAACCFGCGHAEGADGGDSDNDTDSDSDSDTDTDTWQNVGFNGVDLLVVVDNAPSVVSFHTGLISSEQVALATSFFTLINSLGKPVSNSGWEYPPVGNMRVAVVSTDMGLQYGEDGSTSGVPSLPGCDGKGDDGNFQDISAAGVAIKSGLIACDEGGDQCPTGFSCEDSLCVAPDGQDSHWIDCPSSPVLGSYTETSEDDPHSPLATEAACMGLLGKEGCSIEQQLQAAARSLKREGQETDGFIKSDHVLAVLFLTEEDDCSIKDPGLFSTPEWESGEEYQNNDPTTGHLNTACNYPKSNETDYLYDPEAYCDHFIQLKNGNTNAVVMAAIVGVPKNDVCQGRGDEIGDCLDSEMMQNQENLFEHPDAPGDFFYSFTPACELNDQTTGESLITALPGRRFVQLAQRFGSNSYVYSVCNWHWNLAMTEIARIIAEKI